VVKYFAVSQFESMNKTNPGKERDEFGYPVNKLFIINRDFI
jgi:hypothetical protein